MMKSMLFSIIVVLCTISAVAQPPQDLTNLNESDYKDLIEKLTELSAFVESMDIDHNPLDPVDPINEIFDHDCDLSNTEDEQVCNNWDSWVIHTYYIAHPNYPKCPLFVKIAMRLCLDDANNFQFKILNFGAKENSKDCLGLKSYLEEPGALNQLEHDLYSLVSRKIFLDANKDLMDKVRDTLYCTYPDGSPKENNFRITYIKGNCRAFCWAHYEYTRNSEFKIMVKKPIPCLGTSCCKVVNNFCIDRKTKCIRQNEVVTPLNNETNNCENSVSNVDCYNLFKKYKYWKIVAIGHTECKPSCDLKPLYMNDPVIGK